MVVSGLCIKVSANIDILHSRFVYESDNLNFSLLNAINFGTGLNLRLLRKLRVFEVMKDKQL